jgi:hypothetical protein
MTTDNTLGDWGWAQAQQRVVFSTIRNQLGKRNDNASWWQVLNINYRDNAQMQLIAGIISSPVLEPRLSTSGLPELDYYQPDSRALEVSIPYLTPHEQRILRRSLPRPRQRRWPKLVGVGEATVKQYAGFYRWIDAN